LPKGSPEMEHGASPDGRGAGVRGGAAVAVAVASVGDVGVLARCRRRRGKEGSSESENWDG
jgi:hypothetical protein